MSVRGRTCAGHTTLCFYSGIYTQEWKWTVVERAALHASGVWLQLIREASCVGRWFPVYLSLLRQSVLNWLTVVSKPANPLHTCLLTAQVFLLGTASVQSSAGRCTVSRLYCGLFD